VARVVLPGEPITDGQTALRPWRDSDLHAIVRACQDPEIARWTRVPSPYRETDARAYLLQRYDTIQAGESAPFAIVSAPDANRSEGVLLGSIALMRMASGHARAEVGYWLAREARGHGHATRAVHLLCVWGFATLGLERVELFAAVGNGASQRVAERVGFMREAVLRSYLRNGPVRHDAVAYGLLANESGPQNELGPQAR
jgi:RimJ/RimL family protein N-acetyltransferase